ncbi:lipopolysaccharide biosynthesis protein [Jatrophihabitans endophyticus]|uniref:lipopolysaccharide biosynthesis protein n=1 Tax=Jatrophihabitans endophyticus TaxID=1206085 RepID=UPI0019D906AC|nr:hypothetical protein [Jatrophihabitans endophyticus]MBE7187705.1 hypothetical protein [Jatrophihabitans endophyticus]
MLDTGRLRNRIDLHSGARKVAVISASLVGTQAVTSLLGLVYWALAARQSSVAAVGIAGAAVSLMLLLGSVGMLGLGTLLIAELPKTRGGSRRRLVRSALVVSGLASALIGAVVAVGLGATGSASLASLGSPFNVVDFAVGTGLTGLTMVLDQAVLVVGRSNVQLERNTVASVVKIGALALLAVAGHTAGMDIFLAWTIGNLVSLVLVAARFRVRTDGPRDRRLIDLRIVRGLARSAASHHALNLMLQAPILLLSVVVALVLTAEDNGYFSTARSIAGFVFVLPFSVTIALFAAAGGRADELTARMKFTIPFGLAASLAADVVLFPLGPTVLAAFGHSYSVEALTTLRVLALAGLPFVIKDHFVALRRVQNRTGNAAVAALGGAVFELASAVVGAKVDGTVGLCAFWVGALAVEAVVLGVAIRRSVRGGSSGQASGGVSAGVTEVLVSSGPEAIPATASVAGAGAATTARRPLPGRPRPLPVPRETVMAR